MLRVNHVMKKYGDKKVLNDISLQVKKGEIVILLGKSGVGKSTLLRTLNNLEAIDSGTIEINHKKMELKKIAQAHTIGMVFQQFNLFEHMTIIKNISFVLEKVLKKSFKQADIDARIILKKFGLEEHTAKYPSQLSGGQKQRAAIARTLSLNPQVVCFDEPTSALDPLLTTHMANIILDLVAQDYTVLIATHDTLLVEKLKGTIYLMNQGKIIEKADATDFYTDQSAYPQMRAFIRGYEY